MTDPDQAALLRAIHDAHARRCCATYCGSPGATCRSPRTWCRNRCCGSGVSPTCSQQCSDGVRAWLFTVARNQVIDDRRSARYARELQTDSVPERPSPDEIGPAFDKWILSDALKSLSRDHRVAVVRAYYLGQTVADIAAQEQIPEGTVKSRLHYALRSLRIALQERGVVR